MALMVRREVHHHNESQVAVQRDMSEKGFQRVQPAGRRPYADDGWYVSWRRAVCVIRDRSRSRFWGIEPLVLIHGSPVICATNSHTHHRSIRRCSAQAYPPCSWDPVARDRVIIGGPRRCGLEQACRYETTEDPHRGG